MTPGRRGLLALAAVLLALALPGGVLAGGSPEEDHAILVRFRDSITNWAAVKQGGNLEGWDDDTPTYLWHGVVLDFDLRVREINFPCFNFMYCLPAEGPVFPEFAQLERLETLHLSGNHFTGELPDEWAAPGAFPTLQSLTMSSGNLNGSLPRSWGNAGAWPSLTELTLNDNNFHGPVPPEWGNRGAFPKLETLDLGHNLLTDTLPASWGKAPAFPSLQTLSLGRNRISGPLPAAWGSGAGFKELTTLALEQCQLEGALPDSWASPDRFPKLASITLKLNNISGVVPPAWGCEGCFPALQELLLQNNSISGSLPTTWGKLSALRVLDLSSNRLSGALPTGWASPGALPQLVTLSLTENGISGSLPAAWGTPVVLPALSWLDVSSNNISGTLPDGWGVPNSFPRLRLMHLRNNSLTGTLPAKWSFNATLQQLFTWSLAYNQLTGTLPDEWGTTDNSLAALYILDVSYNRLNGSMPANWGTKPSALSSLTTISVAGNNLTDEVPKNWGFLPAMHYLILAPGNNHVCRPLPYAGQFVTCLGDGAICQQPVQLRSNCSSSLPGWVPYAADRGMRALTGLQIGLIVSGVSLVAACSTLVAVLVLQYREQRRWQGGKGLDAELALHGGDSIAELVAATAARKRGGHSALAQKLLKECRVDQADVMFCRGQGGNLVQLGAGAYGQVYKAFLYGVHPVAVKVFQTQDDVPVIDFWKEISILRTCRHDNIVQFQGACVDGDTTMMVTELMDTDLYRALQTNRVNWYRHGLNIAVDVAQALHFLHCRNIIHFDCKSPNILLSTTNLAKLADVGWAQILYHSYITGDGGTFNWAAPEQLIGLKCTAKADVYSYGLVLWELCTRELPVRGQIRDIRIPEEAPQMVADLIRECLNVDPAKRPGMDEIIRRLTTEKVRMASEAASSAASISSSGLLPHRRSAGAGGSSHSGSALRALDGFPGTSANGTSERSSAFNANTSTGAGTSAEGAGAGARRGASSSSEGASGSSAENTRVRRNGSIDSSLWRANSTTAGGSQTGGSEGVNSFVGMPVGGSASASHGGSGPAGAGYSGHGSGSYNGMSVGAGLGSSKTGSGGATGTYSSMGGGSSDGGGSSLFAGSAWATGRPAAAATAASASAMAPSIFEGSAWAAGRPAAALSHASSAASLGGASLGTDTSIGGVFQHSPWWGGSTPSDSQAGAASLAGGGGSSFAGDSYAGMSVGGVSQGASQGGGSTDGGSGSGPGSGTNSVFEAMWLAGNASNDSKDWPSGSNSK